MYVCTDAAAVKVGDQQLLHVTPEHEVEEGAGVFRVLRALYERAAVRHGAGALSGVDYAQLRRALFERSLLQRDADVAAAAAHAFHNVAGVRQGAAVEIVNKRCEDVPVVALDAGEKGQRRRVAGAGDGGVCEGDASLPARVEQVRPAGQFAL